MQGLVTPLLCALIAPVVAHAEEWLPVTSEELQMTEEPLAPKASAIVLYRRVDRDDRDFIERDYVRIKILTEEGRQYANVEIPYYKNFEFIRGLEARTVRPDGTSVPFVGTVYDKEVAAAFGEKLVAKAFALPDVPVGSIIEYKYTQVFRTDALFNSRWILSQPLFTKEANFSLRPNRGWTVRYTWPRGLPDGTSAPVVNRESIRLETHNVPAFVREDHMPPADVMQYRVDFIYVSEQDAEPDPVKFWAKFAKKRSKAVESFVDEPRPMAAAVAAIVAGADSDESRLRKLYARVQQLENLSYEPKQTPQETKREKETEANSVADVWQRGAGTGPQLTWLFLALARAAGFHAEPVLVADRQRVFFDPLLKNPSQLNTNLVLVSLDGKNLYLDPGALYVPFGMLPWSKTAEQGLVLSKEGGRWITTPLPPASDSRILRTAELKLAPDGNLSGRVKLSFTGLEARAARLHERNEDDMHRQKYLETLLKIDIPEDTTVTPLDTPDWESPEQPFEVNYEITIPDWVSLTGQRALAPVGLFSGRWKHEFEHATRIQPIYFPFPFEYTDDVHVALPAGWTVANLPKPSDEDINVLKYRSAASNSGADLRLTRELASMVTLVDVKHFDTIHDFFQRMRSGDGATLVLATGGGHR